MLPTASATQLPPALVLSAHTMGLGVIRALGAKGVPVISLTYDPGDFGQKSKYVNETVPMPHPTREPRAFEQCLLGVCSVYRGAVLIPASDAALTAVSQLKPDLSKYVKVACPDLRMVDLVIQKDRTVELAESCGVLCPLTKRPDTLDEALQAARSIGYPCLVKPVQSHLFVQALGTKMFSVANEKELRVAWEKVERHRLAVTIQEFISGPPTNGANYIAFFVEGRPIAEFTVQKLGDSPPNYGSPCALRSAEMPEVELLGRKLLKGAAFEGFACVEFKKGPDGAYRLMEINARHNLSTALAVKCGLSFPWMDYTFRTTGVPEGAGPWRKGVYWVDILRDARHHWASLGSGRAELLASYFRDGVFAVYDRTDPEPFRTRLKSIAGMLPGRKGSDPVAWQASEATGDAPGAR